MKKKILAVSFLSAMLMLSACNKDCYVMNNAVINTPSKTPIQESSNNSDQSIPVNQDNISSSPDPTSVTYETDGYEITPDSYSEGQDITVSYPQIKGLDDTKIQNTINEILKQDAMSYYSDSSYLATLEILYDIKWKGNNLLSVEYYGWEDYTDTPHPNKLYFTTNINLKTGEKIKLQDVFNIDKLMVESIMQNSIYVAPMDPNDSYLMEDVRFYMHNNLTASCLTDINFYFTRDSLGFSIDVSHAVGGYAQMETKYSDLISSINLENEVWKEFEFEEIKNETLGSTIDGNQSESYGLTISDLNSPLSGD